MDKIAKIYEDIIKTLFAFICFILFILVFVDMAWLGAIIGLLTVPVFFYSKKQINQCKDAMSDKLHE